MPGCSRFLFNNPDSAGCRGAVADSGGFRRTDAAAAVLAVHRGTRRSRVLRASIRIFLDADDRGQFRRRVGSPPSTPVWFSGTLTSYLQFVRAHRGLAEKTTRKYTQKCRRSPQYLERAGLTELDRIKPGHFVSSMRMTTTMHLDARTVPPFGSFSTGPLRRDALQLST